MGGSLPLLTSLVIAAQMAADHALAPPRGQAPERGRREFPQTESERARERAAVDQEILAGDVAGLRRAQECARRAELVGIAEALRRHRGGAFGAELLDRDASALRRRFDVRLE